MRRIIPNELFLDIEVYMNKLLASYTVKSAVHTRIKSVLLYRKLRNYSRVAIQLGTSHGFVQKWNKRACHLLADWNINADKKIKMDKLLQVFSDLPRQSGSKTYTPEHQCQVMAMALKKPEEYNREITHWTYIELADELNKSTMFKGISKSTVGRVLREADIRPHKSRYWLTPNVECMETFTLEVNRVCQLYQKTPQLSEQNTFVISVDEKTGIQALERIHPNKPTSSGLIERREFEYKRHGTVCLTPSFNVATGLIDTHTIDTTRTEQDFAEHIRKTVELSPKSQWIFVLDQLNTHKSESLVKWVAEICEIHTELGEKGKSGILKNMETRMEFLSNPEHRVRFVYTPKHCSWLNQVEIWFSILSRKLLNRGTFSSIGHLKQRLDNFIQYFNANLAKPFKWTYQGKILQV
jgi:hypothetical protein